MNKLATQKAKSQGNRLPWTPMKMSAIGKISEIVQVGGGKLSAPDGDPGEPRKPKGGE